MKRLLLLLWLVASPLMLAGQDYQAPEVKVSTEKVKIGEKLFLVHKVEPRQTVFSICKAYDITADDLNAANPDLKDGLKAGSILYIPLSGEAVERSRSRKRRNRRKKPLKKAASRTAHPPVSSSTRSASSNRSAPLPGNTTSAPTNCWITTVSVPVTWSWDWSC